MKTLTLLSFAQLCKFFSHFGVRTLLVLYLVQKLHYSDARAFGINAVFCGLCELGGIFGGLIADRYLGLKKGMLWGGCLLSLGYCLLIFENLLFVSMGLVIAGASLFSGNITALLALNYKKEDDPNRKKGFTIFYMMQNLGALIATVICGLIAVRFSFRLGFLVAASGMVIGCLALFLCRNRLSYLETRTPKKMGIAGIASVSLFIVAAGALFAENYVLLFLPWLTVGILLFFGVRLLKDVRWAKKQVYTLFILLAALILFFAVEDQICSSLVLFAERETERTLFGWTIPSSFVTGINPIVILLFGALVARKTTQMITPFAVTAVSFGLLALLCLAGLNCSIFGVMGTVAMISIAELMIGPLVLSRTSELALRGSPGMVMGLVPIAFSLAYQLSGQLSKMVAIDERSLSLQIYGTGFGVVAALMLLSGLAMQLLMKRFSNEKNSVC